MDVQRLADGLWRWTTPHPAWDADGIGAAIWPQDVGCVYYESPEATVLIDPLIPEHPTERARFLTALDDDVERRALPVAILRSVSWHERSCPELVARYAATMEAPPDVGVHPLGDPEGEVVFELPGHHTLVVADVLVGSDAIGKAPGAIALCPAIWQDGSDAQRTWWLAEAPRFVATLATHRLERVLVSHGTPVLADGSRLLAGAVALTRNG